MSDQQIKTPVSEASDSTEEQKVEGAVGDRNQQIKTAVSEASDSIEGQKVEGEVGDRNLAIQGNEYAHGLQKVAYKLNKAAHNLKNHAEPLKQISQHFSKVSHDVTDSIHNFNAAELKNKMRAALDDVENHIQTLIDIDSSQNGNDHNIKNAVQTLLRTVHKVEINAKFLGKTKEDVRNEIDKVVKRIIDAIAKINTDDDKTLKDLINQLRGLKDSIDAIVNDIDDFTTTKSNEDSELIKALQDVAQNLVTQRIAVHSAIDSHENVSDLKQKLSTVITEVAEELKKVVVVKEGEVDGDDARRLDKIEKYVLIEGLTAAKHLASNLEVIAKQE